VSVTHKSVKTDDASAPVVARGGRGLQSALLAVGASLVIADVSIVTLALPQLLDQLNTSVEGVAAVIGLYTLVLAVSLPVAGALRGRFSERALASWGFVVFVLGAIVSASAGDLAVLLVGRAVQALGGAGALVGSFGLLDAGRRRRIWLAVAVLSAALGPALGGALTQAFDWRAIFIVQGPLAALGALAGLRAPAATDGGASALAGVEPAAVERMPALAPRWALSLALVLLSGALSAVLFLAVLLLVGGWNISPLAAAAAVSVLPVAAVVGTYLPGHPLSRASVGCMLTGGGILALAWIPQAHLAWTLPPQALAGLGMGMALPTLAGGLLPERTGAESARLLSLRHIGIALVLLAVAPLISTRLSSATHEAKLRGIALVLDTQIEPQSKLGLAPALLNAVETSRPRASLLAALNAHRAGFTGAERVAYDRLASSADDTLLSAMSSSFHDSFLIAGGLALFATALLLAFARRRALTVALVIALPSAFLPVLYASEHAHLARPPVALGNPCTSSSLSPGSGVEGAIQNALLKVIDHEACRLHTSREELILASGDPAEARRFSNEHHGVKLPSLQSLLEGLI
jgi:MFS family permease